MATLTPPALSQCVVIMGARGTGKTVLAERLAAHYRDVIYLDATGYLTPRVPKWTKTNDLRKAAKMFGHVLVVPKPDQRSRAWYDAFFERLRTKRRSLLVLVDELFLLGNMNAMSYPPRLLDLVTMGRKPKVSLWSIVQRPKFVPSTVVELADVWFIFPIPQRDIAVVRDALGDDVANAVKSLPFDYSFIWARREKGGQWVFDKMPPLRLD